jgi:RNA polymerase sigma-70 factor, ECF subfamily
MEMVTPVAQAAFRMTRDATPTPDDSGLSLESIYRQHVQFVWRNARRLGCEDEWVDDAVHEVFLVVARRLDDFEPQADIRSWLFAITYRVVRRLRRNRFRYALRLLRFRVHGNDAPRPEGHAKAEANTDLRRLLARLSDAQRAVVILADLEGMTTPEIARGLGLRPGTVDSRLRAARMLLRAWAERESQWERSTR